MQPGHVQETPQGYACSTCAVETCGAIEEDQVGRRSNQVAQGSPESLVLKYLSAKSTGYRVMNFLHIIVIGCCHGTFVMTSGKIPGSGPPLIRNLPFSVSGSMRHRSWIVVLANPPPQKIKSLGLVTFQFPMRPRSWAEMTMTTKCNFQYAKWQWQWQNAKWHNCKQSHLISIILELCTPTIEHNLVRPSAATPGFAKLSRPGPEILQRC